MPLCVIESGLGWGGGYSLSYEGYCICSLSFRHPLFRSLENLYSFDRYISAKVRKMLTLLFLSKFWQMYSFDTPPPFFDPLHHFESMGSAEHPIPNQMRTPLLNIGCFQKPASQPIKCASWEYHRMHVWCKFGYCSRNLWRVIPRTSRIC